MIKISLTNLQAKVLSYDTNVEYLALKKSLSFFVENYFWYSKYRAGRWDGKYCFYSRYTNSFPPGLLDVMPPRLQERFVIVDARRRPKIPAVQKPIKLEGIKLRDYQIEAITEALKEERCVVQSPTNSGKTEIAAAIIKGLNVKTLFLTHLENLLCQTRERLTKRLDSSVGIISANEWKPKQYTVAMIPTLYMRLKSKSKSAQNFLLNEVECLFLDEVHHLSSTSWLYIAKRCNAYWRYGLSATPVARDAISNLKLIGQTGKVIGAVTNVDLIERGISAKPLIKMVTNRTIGADLGKKAWFTAYRLGIEVNQNRNALMAKLIEKAVGEKKSVLVLINTIRHQNALYLECVERIPPRQIAILNGGTPIEDRMQAIKDMKRGKRTVILATPIFDEGMDMPEIRVLVLAGGGKSQIKLLQRLGRGMRKKTEGENVVEVIDFWDVGNRYLVQHSKKRVEVYKSQGFEVQNVEI